MRMSTWPSIKGVIIGKTKCSGGATKGAEISQTRLHFGDEKQRKKKNVEAVRRILH